MFADVIRLRRYIKYAMERAHFKFGGLFGVFGLAREGAREDDDGQCSNIEIGDCP